MKKLLIAGCVIVVLVVGGLLLTLSNLGPIVKKTVNTVGPKITKTDVRVADVGVSLLGGEVKIEDFFLGNPKGFASDQAMKVGSIYVDVDEKSITQNPIIINKIEIVAPEITYEKVSGSDNFQALLKNVKGSAKQEQTPSGSDAKAEEKPAKKIIINDVIVKDGKVNLSMAALAGKQVSAPLPDIHLKDIGKEKQGATPAEAFEKIFSSLYSSLNADVVTNVLNEGLKQIGGIKEIGSAGLETGTKAADEAVNAAKDSADSATSKLKGLFKTE